MPTDTMTVGQRFKKFRTERGMSQPDVCEGICSYTMVSLLENGKKIPSPRIMGKLAEKLGVPLREIMDRDEQGLDVDFQIEILHVYIETEDYQHALELADKLVQQGNLLHHQEIELLMMRAECLVKTGKYDDVINLLLPFIEEQEAKQVVDNEILCDAFNKLGNAHYRLNDFEKAYSAFEQGYRTSLKLAEFGVVAARVTKNLGLTCNQLGFKEDSRRYLEKAHAFFERASDLKELANSLFDLAIATGSAEYIVKARSIYEGLNLVREANLAKQHYAFHVEARVNYKNAVKQLQHTALEFERMDDIGMSVYSFSRAVYVCLRNEDLGAAGECLDQAIHRRSLMATDNPFVLGYFHRVKAEYNFKLNNYDACIVDSEKSSELCAIMGMYAESADSLQICAKVYELHCEYQKAYETCNKVLDLMRKANRRMSDEQIVLGALGGRNNRSHDALESRLDG